MSTTCRREGGAWKARPNWTDATGQRHWRRVSERLKEDCERRVREIERQAEEAPAGRVPTLAEWSASWLDGISRTRKRATWVVHGQRIRLHVLPALGDRRLDAISPRDVASVIDALPLAPSSAHGVQVTLAICFNAAIEAGLVRRNPARLKRGAKPRPQADAYTQDEIARLAAAMDAQDRAAVLLMAATGLRIGECFGLQWRDLDLGERPRLRVERQRGAGSTGKVVTTPKTPSSRRTVPLGPVTAEMLRRLPQGGPEDWVFPVDRETFSGRLERACRRIGIRDLGSHGLRHAYATHSLEAGVHPKVVQETLGHSDIAITMAVYAHVADELRWEAAAASESLVTCQNRASAKQEGEENGSGAGKP